MSTKNPYEGRPDRSFWRLGVAQHHFNEVRELVELPELGPKDAVATAGSCFAQHIGRHLQRRGACYMDLEPAPKSLTPEEARRHGFGVYSCRYGNIYSVRQLHQLALEALGRRTPVDRVWQKGVRYYDALRPSVDPVGYASPEDVLTMRQYHLSRVKELMLSVDVFVFTLGLTEAWESTEDGTVYPTAPGTVAGEFDPARYRFHNFRYPEVLQDLQSFWKILCSVNPKVRMILTVSPVPLTATASEEHVLSATVYSKSTLRAAAGDLAADDPNVFYFPSYEIIASHPTRGMYFNPDLRTINDAGVELVMSHFFDGARRPATASCSPARAVSPSHLPPSVVPVTDDGLICDEERLDPASRE